MTRRVTLVLADGSGEVLGAAGPWRVDLPWWQEVGPVVAAARKHLGVKVAVLRILSTEPGLRHGGAVTYLAEVDHRPGTPLAPAEVDTREHPLRADYARPGGPARSLAWARRALGVPITRAQQLRTWNLSAIWRLETAAGTVFLKQVPGFFRHEAAVLSYLDQLRAADEQGRMLLDEIAGEDLYGADLPTRELMVRELFAIQSRAAADLGALATIGVPDRRDLTTLGDQPWLADRLARAEGLPATLVHGDFHPGNVRGGDGSITIIDWGDSFIGHPAFDILRLTEDADETASARLIALWSGLWRTLVPLSNPEAAVEALRPVAALRNAATYAGFLAGIEPSEHPYHAEDVPYWLAEAERLANPATA